MHQIGIDIDEVLFPFIKQFRKFTANKLNRPMDSFPDPLQWSFWDEWGITKEDFYMLFAGFIRNDGFLNCDPIDGTIRMVEEIASRNKVTFVTARGFFDGMTDYEAAYSKFQTIEWLHDVGLSTYPIVFTNHKNILKLDIHVDDAVHHLTECRLSGIFPICMDASHNIEWDGPRAKTPTDVVKLISDYTWQKQALGSLLKEPSLLY